MRGNTVKSFLCMVTGALMTVSLSACQDNGEVSQPSTSTTTTTSSTSSTTSSTSSTTSSASSPTKSQKGVSAEQLENAMLVTTDFSQEWKRYRDIEVESLAGNPNESPCGLEMYGGFEPTAESYRYFERGELEDKSRQYVDLMAAAFPDEDTAKKAYAILQGGILGCDVWDEGPDVPEGRVTDLKTAEKIGDENGAVRVDFEDITYGKYYEIVHFVRVDSIIITSIADGITAPPAKEQVKAIRDQVEKMKPILDKPAGSGNSTI